MGKKVGGKSASLKSIIPVQQDSVILLKFSPDRMVPSMGSKNNIIAKTPYNRLIRGGIKTVTHPRQIKFTRGNQSDGADSQFGGTRQIAGGLRTASIILVNTENDSYPLRGIRGLLH
jgi:hypothetical protein